MDSDEADMNVEEGSVEQLDDSKEQRSAFIWYSTETARLTIANDILLSLYRGTMCSIVTGFVSGI